VKPPQTSGDLGEGSSTGTDGLESYTMEAAYSLQTMYALNGDLNSARAITERWMVVE